MKESANKLFENDERRIEIQRITDRQMQGSVQIKGWKLNEDYAWAKSVLKTKRCLFHHILSHVDSDMALFYRISPMEIHPTPGLRFALMGTCLPLPAVPMVLFGVVDREQLHLDFLTGQVIHRVTCRLRMNSFPLTTICEIDVSR